MILIARGNIAVRRRVASAGAFSMWLRKELGAYDAGRWVSLPAGGEVVSDPNPNPNPKVWVFHHMHSNNVIFYL